MSKVGFRCPECNAVLIVSGRDAPAASPVADSKFLSTRIDEIDWGKNFNARIRHLCAWNPPITTISDLLGMSEAELLICSNFGRRSLEQVRRILQAQGLHMKRI